MIPTLSLWNKQEWTKKEQDDWIARDTNLLNVVKISLAAQYGILYVKDLLEGCLVNSSLARWSNPCGEKKERLFVVEKLWSLVMLMCSQLSLVKRCKLWLQLSINYSPKFNPHSPKLNSLWHGRIRSVKLIVHG